jgi:hypothetical protein
MADSRFTAAQRSTATIATQPGAIDTAKIYILGVFGTSQRMKAMIREPFSGLRTVKTGDRTSVGVIQGIDAKGLLILQGGETRRLSVTK